MMRHAPTGFTQSSAGWLFLVVGTGAAIGILATAPTTGFFILGSLGVLVILLASLQQPVWTLCLLLFVSYLNLSDIAIEKYDAPSMAKLLTGTLLAIIVIRALIFSRFPKIDRTAFLMLAAYWLVTASSLLHASDAERAFAVVNGFTRDAIITVLVLALLENADDLRRVIWTFVLAALVLGGATTHQYLTGSFDWDYFGIAKAQIYQIVGEVESYRTNGPLDDPNMYAQILLFLVPVAWDRMLHEPRRFLRPIAAVAFTVSSLAVIFTFSRGALIALAMLSLVALAQALRRPGILVAAGLLLAVLFPLVPETYVDRVQFAGGGVEASTPQQSIDASIEGRLTEMRIAAQMFMDNPLLGIGVGNYEVHFQEYVQRLNLPPRHEARAAHSLYLEIAAERGLLGLAAFGALIWLVIRYARESRRTLTELGEVDASRMIAAVAVGLLGYCIAAMFLHDSYPRYFWLIVGIALSARQIALSELSSHHKDDQGTPKPLSPK